MVVITSHQNSIAVNAPESILRAIVESDFGPKYIPAYSISDGDEGTALVLEVVKANETSFQFDYPLARLALVAGQYTTRDIISVIDYCLDYERQKDGWYSVHGSACSLGGVGLLCFGPVSGLGKTSLVLKLCEQGFEFIGDEKVLLHEDGLIGGGVTTIEFNKTILHQIAGNHLHNHDTKTEEHIKVASEPAKLSVVVQPIIVPGAELIIEEWSSSRADWHLYEELSRKIRGVSRRISNFSYALQSIDSPELSSKRVAASKVLSQTARFYTIRGDLEAVVNEVKELTVKNG